MQSLSFRFLVAFIAIIIITTLLTGVPAYLEIRTELDKQAWAHVLDGGRVTMALLETEKSRLENLAALVAQRPTLHSLVQQQDLNTLNQYLQTFQTTVDLDILVLNDQSGQVLAKGSEFYLIEMPFSQEAVFQRLNSTRPQLALLASKPLPINSHSDQEFFVTVGIFLDNHYAKKLASETGFEHSFLMDEQRVSTTLDGAPSILALETVRLAIASGTIETAPLNFQNSHYHIALLPLFGANDEVIALAEVMQPTEYLLAANRTALFALMFSALFVMLAASGLASYFAQRLIAPLKDLAASAVKISQGDLNSPVPIPNSPSEITTLATAFEKSRNATLIALENLNRAKVWSETLIQSVVEGIVTIDGQGKVTSFNQGAEQITGWKSAEVLGMSINHVFPLMEEDDFMQHVSLTDGVQRINIKSRQGSETTLAVTSAPLRSPKGDAAQMAFVLRDISEEDATQRLRSYFLSNISHEFRTPLSALNASVELLLENVDEFSLAEIAELLNSIHLSVTGLQTLIDNLLESTSMEAGRFRIRRRPTDLRDVVTDALQVMKPLLERRRQHINLTIPSQIHLVNADPARLAQVLINLLSNASKYGPMESTIELQLKLMNGETLRVSVSDQGPGIPPPERSKLYHRFMRLDVPESAQYGIGLGLSVVKAIVEAHGGEVGMDERPGGGSIFWFTIPLQEEM